MMTTAPIREPRPASNEPMLATTDAFGEGRLALLIAVPIMLVGAAFRAKMFLGGRSLWLDEAMLALNLQGRSFVGLLKPLDYDQAAPVGFLWLCKAAMRCFGDGERAMRLVAFIAGMASLPLFWAVVRRWLGVAGCLVAITLFSISPNLIYYSSEVKQYGVDVAVTMLILWLAVRVADRPSTARNGLFVVVGAASTWLSHTSIFVLPAAFVAWAAGAWEEPAKRRVGWAAGGVACFGSFIVNYVLFLGPVAHSAAMKTYWAAGLMPWSIGSGGKFLLRIVVEVFNNAVGCSVPAAMDVAFAAGCIAFGLRGKRLLMVVVGPVALVFVAAVLRVYPFTARLVLFAVPLMIATVAGGIEYLWMDRSPRRWIAPVMLALIVAYMGRDAVASLSKPTMGVPQRQEMKPVLAHVQAHLQAGDHIFLYPSARAAFTFYAPRYGLSGVDTLTCGDIPMRGFTQGWTETHSWESLGEEVAKLKGKGRVWVILSHIKTDGGVDEEQLFRFFLDQHARRLDKVGSLETGSIGYLYDFGS